MLFTQRFWPLIGDGTVTVTFRRWRRCQVVAGHRYRTPAGIIEVDTVDVVDPVSIDDDDAVRSGFASHGRDRRRAAPGRRAGVPGVVPHRGWTGSA